MTQIKRKKWPIVIAILTALVVIAGVGFYLYLDNNKNYDRRLMKGVTDAGYITKEATTPGGATIAYAEGPENGEVLLLIHGQGMSWQDYDTVLPGLAKSFQVFAVDVYGHGESTHDPALYSCEKNGEDLVWFIREVIGEPVYLSGHSSGGLLAAWVAANAQENVKGLLLEDPPFFSVTPEEVQEGKGAFTWFDTYSITHDFLQQDVEKDYALYYLRGSYFLSLFGDLGKSIVESAEKVRAESPDQPILVEWVPHTWLRTLLYIDNYDPAFGETFYNGSWLEGVDQEKLLQSIQCPVVYMKANTVYGEDGVLYAANTDEDAEKVMQLLKHGTRIDIESGHDIHFDHPKEFVEAIESNFPAR